MGRNQCLGQWKNVITAWYEAARRQGTDSSTCSSNRHLAPQSQGAAPTSGSAILLLLLDFCVGIILDIKNCPNIPFIFS
jgi:hypothetical protein